ncbi:phosphoenolpyruvate--protein phosphotransferase [Candidatus Mycoplasma pogonae]
MSEKHFKGIGASSGVAIAKVFKLKETHFEIDDHKIADINAEVEKYQAAVVKAIKRIENIKKLSYGKLSDEEIEVFDAHIQVATDPAMQDEVLSLIQKSFNAAYAVDQVSQNYITMFSSMDDDYMKERAADIKDVAVTIIKNLLGIEIVDLTAINEPTIIVAHDLTPSETAQLDKQYVKGFLTNIGGRTSHSAIMARSLEIPAILGLENITELVENGDIVAINGDKGEGIIKPSETSKAEFEKAYQKYLEYKNELQKFLTKPSVTKDGKQVLIAANIGSISDAEAALQYGHDAIGLFRSEFLYMDAENWPSEEEQFQAYKAVLEKTPDKSVIVRTLDIGGDKTLKYFQFPEEMNPFLGYRAIRMTLDKKDIFRTQLRALIRASVYGKLGIMFPMITTVQEFLDAKAFYEEVLAEVKADKIPVADKIELGMMVEVPAAAVLTDQFSKHVDFVSIGTNDLMQYTMAADRMSQKVSYLYQPLNPSILKLIKMTIDGAHKQGKWAGMCGEMAGEPAAIPLLVGMGLDEFSMSATSILAARKQISEIDTEKAKILVAKALECETEAQVHELVENFNKNL